MLEQGRGYKRLRDELKVPVAEIARRAAVTEDHLGRTIRIAEAPAIIHRAIIDGVKVPKVDRDGKPEYVTKGGQTVMETVGEGAEAKEVPKVKQVTAKIEDMDLALAMLRLYAHLVEKHTPRLGEKGAQEKAEAGLEHHLSRVLSLGLPRKKVQQYVRGVVEGQKGEKKEKADAGRPKDEATKALKGGASMFHREGALLTVDTARLGELDAAGRAAIEARLEQLLGELRKLPPLAA